MLVTQNILELKPVVVTKTEGSRFEQRKRRREAIGSLFD